MKHIDAHKKTFALPCVHIAENWNHHEQLRLRLPPFSCASNRDDMRLACQVEVIEDLIVTKGGGAFGQDRAPSSEPAEAFKTYLDEKEFIFDTALSGYKRSNPKVTRPPGKELKGRRYEAAERSKED